MIPYDPVDVCRIEKAVGLVRTIFVARTILRPLQTYFFRRKKNENGSYDSRKEDEMYQLHDRVDSHYLHSSVCK